MTLFIAGVPLKETKEKLITSAFISFHTLLND